MGDASPAWPLVTAAPLAAVYFISFPLLSGVILMNVVIAVLLEKFCEDDDDDDLDMLEEEKEKYAALDSLPGAGGSKPHLGGAANLFATAALKAPDEATTTRRLTRQGSTLTGLSDGDGDGAGTT